MSTHRSIRPQFARLHGSSNESASREIRFFVRATAYERHFCCRAQADLANFFFRTRSRSSSERACWIGDVRSVFVFCLCFPMFVYLLKTVPHMPLYMTSTYNSKTAVQYHMTPIYNNTLTTVQYRTFTDPLRSYKPYLLDCLTKHPCCARSVLYARYLHKLPGYIYTIPTIYTFSCGIYSMRTSMITCCDYIYILCGDTYIMNVTERQLFWRSPSTARGHTGGRSRKIAQPAGPLLCTTIIKSHIVHERLIVPTQDYVLYK